ncbi:MAG: sigma-70 family RNA polymerase sigma factor [Acidobacteriota bacterium]
MKGPGEERSEAELATGLVHRIEAGDEAAEGELFKRYHRGLHFMLRRQTGNSDLADDLVQEAFRVVLERLRSTGLDDPARLGGFLHRTARNLFIADYRKKTRRQDQDLEDVTPPADPAPGQLSQILLDEEAALVRQVIEELRPERDRELLYRFYLLEQDKQTICTELGLTSLHFNRVRYRAQQRFKDLLERSRKRQKLGQVP